MEKNAKIYVAGHSGLVGTALLNKLKSAGYTKIITRELTELDLVNQHAVEQFFLAEKPEYVFLLAAKVGGVALNDAYPSEFLYENLLIECNVIWCAHLYRAKKLLFAGSALAYAKDCNQPMKEEDALRGQLDNSKESYAISKMVGIKLCEKIYDQYNKAFVSCLINNIYGDNDHFDSRSGHVVPALIHRMHDAKVNNIPKVQVWGSGNAKREFIHADDVASAMVFLMDNNTVNKYINVGTGIPTSIKELAEVIKNTVGYTGDLFFDVSKPDGVPLRVLDTNKLTALGFKAKISLREGIASAYKSYLKTLE